jgi:hypothetical protein
MKKNAPFVTLVFVALVFIAFFYGKVLMNPNSYLFNDTGDGFKNYYTFYYHSVNDSSYTEFNGMNYPYGEHYLYTDCHPIIANTFQFLGNFSDEISRYPIGFLNFIMIAAIFFTFLLVYKLLVALKINPWIATIFTIGIVILQPQIFRITGHFALSYSIAIPLAWLLLIKSYNKGRKASYVWLLFATNLFWFFIHAYLGMILVFFQLAFYLVVYINDKIHHRGIDKRHLRFFFAAVIPPLIFRLYVFITDDHLYRTDNPSGFFLYNAEPDDFFVPHHPPFRTFLDKISGLEINLQWEAWNYIGLVFGIITAFVLILSLSRIFTNKTKPLFDRIFNQTILNLSLLASLIVLLFAFAFPFKLFPSLTDFIPWVKQFRATGRFGWVFYYVGSVFSVYVIQQIYDSLVGRKHQAFAYILIALTGIIPIVEGWAYHTETSGKITQTKNLFLEENLPKTLRYGLDEISPDEYQALIPIPFYYIGSESFSRPVQNKIEHLSMLISAYKKIPIIGAYLTRTSIQESKNSVQLMSPAYYPKKIMNDISNEKPFLLVASKEQKTKYELALLTKSQMIFTSSDYSFYKIEKDELFKNTYAEELKKFRELKPRLKKQQGFLTDHSGSYIFYNDYEKSKSKIAFESTGAYSGIKKGKNEFASFDPNTFEKDKTYVVAAWMYNNHKDALNLWFRFMVEEYDEPNNQWFTTTGFPEFSEVIYGNWSLVELEFKVRDPKNKVLIVSKGKDNSKADLHLDDLLIYEKGALIYKVKRAGSSPVLFKNNQDIRRN